MANNAGTKGVPRAEREKQLLDAAVTEFGTRGYENASTTRIALEVGVSKAMVFSYFGSKEGLFLACVHRAGSTIVEHVESAQIGHGSGRALATLRAIFTALEPRRLDWAVLYDPSLPAGSAALDAATKYRRRLAEIGWTGTGEVLAEAGDQDAADASLAAAIWFNTVSAAVLWWIRQPAETVDSVTARLGRIWTRLENNATAPSVRRG